MRHRRSPRPTPPRPDRAPGRGTATLRRGAALLLAALSAGLANAQTKRFDFGSVTTAPGYVAVDTVTYSAALGHGWVNNTGLLLRDRAVADDLRTDFVFKNSAGSSVFRVSGLAPGLYVMTAIFGDASYGDHYTTVTLPGAAALPTIAARAAEYITLTTTATVDATGVLDITFSSPTNNWVVNALSLEPTATTVPTSTESTFITEWKESVFATDPTAALLARLSGEAPAGFAPTGLTRSAYLTLIQGQVDFWKTKQNSSGAIIDPYANSEIQYSTPAYAQAAATAVAYANRADLLETAALAMDWASSRLKVGQAAGGHDDFYPPMLAHAYRLLAPRVGSTRAAAWRANLDFDPYSIYNYAPGSFNWNVVAACGEALFQQLGLRPATHPYVQHSWAAQGRHFTSPFGLYMEGPMAYDHFPRIFFADAIAQGYDGPYSFEVGRAMDRAAITSLFMQSPWGELPAGGRSAHHQWNEAEQCLTYEIYAAKAKAAGDTMRAAAYKRAARLALASMARWVRPSGEMQIVKNWIDPVTRHGYESYSYHSQYNLLPTAMLSSAYEYAGGTEDIAEGPAPADTGGFVFQIPGVDKIFANAGGTYVELDTSADLKYDATGLIRVHRKGVPPQLGPSDSLLASSSYSTPVDSPLTLGVGVSWQDGTGTWRTLGSMVPTSATLTTLEQSRDRVAFNVTYSGGLTGVSGVTERYVLTPQGVTLTTEVAGYSGPLRYVWPVLSHDGKTASTLAVVGNTLSVAQGAGLPQTFTASGASSLTVGASAYSNHNGSARIATAEYPSGGAITLLIGNEAPTLAAVADQTLAINTASAPIPLLLGDANDPVASLTLAGSAANPALIPPGGIAFAGSGASRTLVLTPAANASGTTTVTLVVGDGTALASRSFNVTVLDATQSWRQRHFGADATDASLAGDLADPDGDGLPNLAERALGSDPRQPSADAAPRAGVSGDRLDIRFTRDATALDDTIRVLAADAPGGEWREIARSANGAAFTAEIDGSPSGATITETGAGDLRAVQVTDPVDLATRPSRFLRLKFER